MIFWCLDNISDMMDGGELGAGGGFFFPYRRTPSQRTLRSQSLDPRGGGGVGGGGGGGEDPA